MRWVIAILEALLRALLPAILKASKHTAEDGATQAELRERLRRKVRKTWRLGILILLVVLLLPGCGTRTIYVPHGTPVRLRETIRDARVWVLDANGKPVAGRIDLPEGWFCLPVTDGQDGPVADATDKAKPS